MNRGVIMIDNIKNYPCTHVLPLVYDDSLSYYENICKLTNKMNEIINFFNGNIEQQLKDYIEKEFNNMMLNAMYDANTETLSLYLRKVG